MPQTVADARTMSRKIYGRITKDREPVPTEGEATPKSKRRARGMDYASLVAHFAKLLETVSASPRYMTNEQELTVESLKAFLATLRNHNSSVIEATVSWQEARKKRNEVLYSLDRSLYDVGRKAKQYVKSVYGYNSAAYHVVRQISFTKPSLL